MAQVNFGLSGPPTHPNNSPTFGLTGGSTATPAPVGAPVPAASASAPTAPETAPAAVPAQPKQKPLLDFDENPLGAIGAILQEVSAGILGTEGPIAKKRKQQIEEQALKLRQTAATIDAVEAFGKLSKNIPAGQMEDAITQFEATVQIPGLGDLLRASAAKGTDAAELAGYLKNVPEAGPFLATMLQRGFMTPEDAVEFTTTFLGDRLKAGTEIETAVAKQAALAPGEVAQAAAKKEAEILAEIRNPKPTTLEQELKSAGLKPGTDEYQATLLAIKTKPLVSNKSPFGTAKAEERQSAAIETIGLSASTKVATSRMVDLIASGTETGALEGGKMLLKAYAADLGVDVDEEALGKQQEFDRLSKDITLNSMQRFKGAMSDRELNFGINTVSNIGKTEEGNIKALAALQAASEIALENSSRLAGANSAKEVRDIEIQIAKRSADDIKKRTAELENEIRVRIARQRETAGQPTVESIQSMSADEVKTMANRLGDEGLGKLGPDVLDAMLKKINESKGDGG